MFEKFSVSNVLLLLFCILFCSCIGYFIIRSLFTNQFTVLSVLSIFGFIVVFLVPVITCVIALIDQIKMFFNKE